MTKPLVSRHKADKFGLASFLLGLAVLSFLNSWWPGIALVFGLSLAIRRLFEGKYYDALLSLVIFGGIFAAVAYNFTSVTVIFVIAAIVVLFRAFSNQAEDEIEEEENLEKEIEEDRE